MRKHFIILFSFIFQAIVDCEASQLSQLLGIQESDAVSMQECCQRKLDEQLEADEALLFLKMLKTTANVTESGEPGEKRPRMN